MSVRKYYIRHVPACALYSDLKARIKLFKSGADAGCNIDFCTADGCRIRPDPIVFLVPDPYWDEALAAEFEARQEKKAKEAQ